MKRRGGLAVLILALIATEAARGDDGDDARLAEVTAAIRRADYRGDRAELARLAGQLGSEHVQRLLAPRAYWRGFAHWRRAINGFNETPTPADLRQDMEAAVASFRTALEARPGWIEPQIGMVGCMGTLLYLGGAEDPRRAEIAAEARLLFQEISRSGMDNSRALWIIGGYQLGAPPPLGGQPDKAAATMRQGLEAARAEALSTTPRAPHDPVWGAAENLMNLAYLHSHSTLANRDLAFAYAAGALAVVPEWHYVKDVLWPQIEAMAPPGR